MRLLWRPALVLCTASLCLACSSDSDDALVDDTPALAEVLGTVLTSDGEAISYAAVQLISSEQTLKTTSDQDGRFVFAELPVPRTWAIAAEVEHYEPFTQDVVGLQAGETRDVSVTLTAVIVFASVVGEVWLDDGYLDPMEAYNVPIQLMADDRTFRTETDYDGAFTFDYVPITREWTLSVDLEGHPPFTETVRGLAEGEERSVFVMLVEIDPRLPWHWQTGSELGQLAPDFTLPDSDGNLISLSSYRDRSNVLLAFHQGVLCPVCPAQLGQLLSSHNAEVEALAWKTLAISHETVANNQRLTLLHNVPFPMLADTSRQTIRDYDIADPLLGISKTAFFLIDLDGSIQWKSTDHSNVDPNDLPEWEDIRRELEEHAGRVAY